MSVFEDEGNEDEGRGLRFIWSVEVGDSEDPVNGSIGSTETLDEAQRRAESSAHTIANELVRQLLDQVKRLKP